MFIKILSLFIFQKFLLTASFSEIADSKANNESLKCIDMICNDSTVCTLNENFCNKFSYLQMFLAEKPNKGIHPLVERNYDSIAIKKIHAIISENKDHEYLDGSAFFSILNIIHKYEPLDSVKKDIYMKIAKIAANNMNEIVAYYEQTDTVFIKVNYKEIDLQFWYFLLEEVAKQHKCGLKLTGNVLEVFFEGPCKERMSPKTDVTTMFINLYEKSYAHHYNVKYKHIGFIISQILANTNPENKIHILGFKNFDMSLGFLYFMEIFRENIPRINKLILLNYFVNWRRKEMVPKSYQKYIENINDNVIDGKGRDNCFISGIVNGFLKNFGYLQEVEMQASLYYGHSIQIYFLKNEHLRQKLTDLYLKNRDSYNKDVDLEKILHLNNLRSLTLNVENENEFIEIFEKIPAKEKIRRLSLLNLSKITSKCVRQIEDMEGLKNMRLAEIYLGNLSSSGILKSKKLQMRLQGLKICNYYKFDCNAAEQIGCFTNLINLELVSCIFSEDSLSYVLTNKNLVNSLERLNLKGSGEILEKHVGYLEKFKSLKYLDITYSSMSNCVRNSIVNNDKLKAKIEKLAI